MTLEGGGGYRLSNSRKNQRHGDTASPSKNCQIHFMSKESPKAQEEAGRNESTHPKLPRAIAHEIMHNYSIRLTKKLQERKELINQVRSRREFKRSLSTTDLHLIQDRTSVNSDPFVNQMRLYFDPKCNENDANKRSSFLDKERSLQGLPIAGGKQPIDQFEIDYHACDVECARLRLENQALNTKLVTKDMHFLLLRQQVNHLTLETKNMRGQLCKWQTKSKEKGKLLSKRRIKLDNSAHLIAEARTGLTKALNDAGKLETKIFDLETNVAEKDRHVKNLYDTIERQTQIIREMTIKLRDKDTVLRLNENEKRKLEDEVQVLIASKGRKDIGRTLRYLERERETWLSDREEKIEAARIELENENDRIFEREKAWNRRSHDILIDSSNKKRQVEEKQQKSQQYVNDQLDYMMEINRKLQQKFTKEREELASQTEQQDNTIHSFELRVLDLHNHITTRIQTEKDVILRKAEVELIKEDLRDAREQNKLLHKKMNELGSKGTTEEELMRLRETLRILKKSLSEQPRRYKRKQKRETKANNEDEGQKKSNIKTQKQETKSSKKKKRKNPYVVKKKRNRKTRKKSQSNTVLSPGIDVSSTATSEYLHERSRIEGMLSNQMEQNLSLLSPMQ